MRYVILGVWCLCLTGCMASSSELRQLAADIDTQMQDSETTADEKRSGLSGLLSELADRQDEKTEQLGAAIEAGSSFLPGGGLVDLAATLLGGAAVANGYRNRKRRLANEPQTGPPASR